MHTNGGHQPCPPFGCGALGKGGGVDHLSLCGFPPSIWLCCWTFSSFLKGHLLSVRQQLWVLYEQQTEHSVTISLFLSKGVFGVPLQRSAVAWHWVEWTAVSWLLWNPHLRLPADTSFSPCEVYSLLPRSCCHSPHTRDAVVEAKMAHATSPSSH